MSELEAAEKETSSTRYSSSLTSWSPLGKLEYTFVQDYP